MKKSNPKPPEEALPPPLREPLPDDLLWRLRDAAIIEAREPAAVLKRLLDGYTIRPLGHTELHGIRDDLEAMGELCITEARELMVMIARLSLGIPEFRDVTLTVYGDGGRVLAGVIAGGPGRQRKPK